MLGFGYITIESYGRWIGLGTPIIYSFWDRKQICMYLFENEKNHVIIILNMILKYQIKCQNAKIKMFDPSLTNDIFTHVVN
jgi:hypothetical protein